MRNSSGERTSMAYTMASALAKAGRIRQRDLQACTKADMSTMKRHLREMELVGWACKEQISHSLVYWVWKGVQ